MVSRATTTLLGFATVRLALRYLGSQGYGIWLVLATLPDWLRLLEFGMGPLLRNRIAHASTTAAQDQMREALGVVFRFLTGVVIIGVAISFFALRWNPWRWLLALGTTSPQDIPTAAWTLVIVGLLTLPFTVAGHLVVGLQRGYLLEISQMASAVLVVIGLLPLNYLAPQGDFLLGVLVLGVLPQAAVVAFFCLVFWLPVYRALRPALGRINQSVGLLLGRQQWLFFGQHTSSLVISLGESWVILHLLSPESVAQAGVVQRWYIPIIVFQSILVAPLYPAYAEAMSRGDVAWARETLKRFSRRSLTLMGLAGVALLFVQPWYVQLVSQGVVESDAWLGGLFCLRALQHGWGLSYATFLMAAGRIERLMLYNWLAAVLYLPFTIVLGNVWGSRGVILGGILAYTPVILSNRFHAGRVLRERVGLTLVRQATKDS